MKVVVVYGTRPELIKLQPLIEEMLYNGEFEVECGYTNQHPGLDGPVDQVLGRFRRGVPLHEMLANIVSSCGIWFDAIKPDLAIVQGDTTTALGAALAAFNLGIPIAHVEAGLRTHDLKEPWPEEGNRVLIDRISDFCFAPTKKACWNLAGEGVWSERIFEVGNTGIDALMSAAAYDRTPGLDKDVLVTVHRRENWRSLIWTVAVVNQLARVFKNHRFIIPMHPNPRVQRMWDQLDYMDNIYPIRPLSYDDTICLLRGCCLVMTDSGGLQEEAATLGKRTLVLRNKTERPEGVTAGIARLIGTDPADILREAHIALSADVPDQPMNLYGDGTASKRIVQILNDHFSRKKGSEVWLNSRQN